MRDEENKDTHFIAIGPLSGDDKKGRGDDRSSELVSIQGNGGVVWSHPIRNVNVEREGSVRGARGDLHCESGHWVDRVGGDLSNVDICRCSK